MKDKLTKYNDEVITYDNIGNPVTIGNKTLNFINGRELKSYVDNYNNLNVSYKYNKDGIRIEKIVNNDVIKYYVEHNKVILEERGNNMIYYIRDEKGNLEGMKYNNDLYYYIKNLQNDIIGLIDSNNNVVATYEYDSYGNIISIKDGLSNEITDKENIAIINPYRYRSYYYDTKTNLYYLCSRYYNPVWGRFINADGYIKAGSNIFSNNMFAYCGNNPVNKYDVNGTIEKWISNAWNVVKELSKVVVQRVKEDFEFYKQTFTFEIGSGKGLGGDLSSFGYNIKVKTDAITYGTKYKNGEVSCNSKSSGGVGFGFIEYSDEIEKTIACNYETNYVNYTDYEFEHNYNFEITPFKYLSMSNDYIFIGIDIETYMFVGGYIKFGFEIPL